MPLNSCMVAKVRISVKTLLAGEKPFTGEVELPDHSTIGSLLGELQVELEEVFSQSNVQILINGVRADQAAVLKAGDRVHVLSALIGG